MFWGSPAASERAQLFSTLSSRALYYFGLSIFYRHCEPQPEPWLSHHSGFRPSWAPERVSFVDLRLSIFGARSTHESFVRHVHIQTTRYPKTRKKIYYMYVVSENIYNLICLFSLTNKFYAEKISNLKQNCLFDFVPWDFGQIYTFFLIIIKLPFFNIFLSSEWVWHMYLHRNRRISAHKRKQIIYNIGRFYYISTN